MCDENHTIDCIWWGCSCIIKLFFLILDTVNMVLLFFQFDLKMAVHAALTKKKIYEVKTFDTFLRRVNFILIFLQEELGSI